MDPALTELNEAGPADEEVSLILRLQDGAEPPPTVRVVCRFGPIITVRCRRADILPTWESDRVISVKAPRAVHLPRQLGERRPPAEIDEAAAAERAMDPEEAEAFAEGEPARRQRQPLPALPVDGRGVVVGICDWGFDFTHPNFRNADGSTRLLALWDQRGTGDPRAPAPYNQGRLFTPNDINAALAQPDPCAALGYHPSSGDPNNTGSHGTHVSDIVAGNRRYPGSEVGLASGADLVFVHLGAQRLGELGNLGDSVSLLEGLDFVRRTAAAAGRPCVMHLSAGKTGGPHGGTTLVERAVDALLLDSPGIVLVQSVGNYADTAMHTHARIGPDQTHVIDWLIPPGDRTPNELEIWYDGRDVFDVTLVAPDGQEFSASLGRRARLGDGGDVWGNFYHRLHEPNSGLNHIDIFLYTAAPTGPWKVVVHGREVVDGRLHAWIERDAGSRYQSRFSRAQATSSYTTNTICNCFRAIAVGAYDATRPERPPARFSSRGPTADGRQKPELAAPGFHIRAARSMPRDGWNGERKLVVKSGTSMAAPWVSGTVALMFQAAGRPLTIHEVRRILIGTTDPHAGPHGRSSSQLGFGYLNTAAAVEAARRLGGGTAATTPPPIAFSLEQAEAQQDEAQPIGSTWIEEPLGEAAGSASVAPASAVKFKLAIRVETYKPPHPAVPLSGATARVVGGSASSTSDAHGNAVLTLDPGKQTIRLDAADHFSAAVTPDLQSDLTVTVALHRKALVGPRLRSSAWVNGTQDKLPMFKSDLAAGHCDSVIWQLFFVNGKSPDGYSRHGPRGVNFQEWDRSKFKVEVDRIHAIGALAWCEWVRAEERGDFAVLNNMLLGRGSVSMTAFKKAILAELDAYCQAGVFWDGVSFDLENVGLKPSNSDAVAVRNAMTAFMDDLGTSLHQSGRLLAVTVGAKTFDSVTDPKQTSVNDAAPGEGGMQFVYDWKGLGQGAVDYLPCMCYSADASGKNINFSDKIIQQTLVHAGKTCGFDKFLLGVSPDDGRHVALAKLARVNGCGISVFTANSGNTWKPVDAELNPSGPLACFAEQPKGTPRTTLDMLNKRDPPQPTACPP